jgi:hypothetical protein
MIVKNNRKFYKTLQISILTEKLYIVIKSIIRYIIKYREYVMAEKNKHKEKEICIDLSKDFKKMLKRNNGFLKALSD